MKNMIKLTQIHSQEWHGILGIKILRKKSTTAEIFIDPTKIIILKRITPKKPENIHKDFPTYTNIQLTGNYLI